MANISTGSQFTMCPNCATKGYCGSMMACGMQPTPLQLGQINFAPCTGCQLPGECSTHQSCASKALPLTERGTVERFRYVLSPGESKPAALQGWECPRCGCIHAPFIPSCACKPPGG